MSHRCVTFHGTISWYGNPVSIFFFFFFFYSNKEILQREYRYYTSVTKKISWITCNFSWIIGSSCKVATNAVLCLVSGVVSLDATWHQILLCLDFRSCITFFSSTLISGAKTMYRNILSHEIFQRKSWILLECVFVQPQIQHLASLRVFIVSS